KREQASSVMVPMMQVRIVGMIMLRRHVTVPMRVRFCGHGGGVAVLMMLVMHVAVLMLDRLMGMAMGVALSEGQPESASHQSAGKDELYRQWLAEHRYRQQRTNEGGQRIVHARSRGA